MSFAVLATNSSIKVNGAVNNILSADGTLHTAPANGYSIVQVIYYGNFTPAKPSLSIGGNIILKAVDIVVGQVYQLYIPTGQSIITTEIGGSYGTGRVTITGVSFINSP